MMERQDIDKYLGKEVWLRSHVLHMDIRRGTLIDDRDRYSNYFPYSTYRFQTEDYDYGWILYPEEITGIELIDD